VGQRTLISLGVAVLLLLAPAGAQAAGAKFRVLNAGAAGPVTIQVNGKTKVSKLKLGRTSRRKPLAAGRYTFTAVRPSSKATIARLSVRVGRGERVTIVFTVKGRKPQLLLLREPAPAAGQILLRAANFSTKAGAVDFRVGALVIARKVGYGRTTTIRKIAPDAAPTGLLDVTARRPKQQKPITSEDPLVLARGSIGLFVLVPKGKGSRLIRLPYDKPPPAPKRQPTIKGKRRYDNVVRCGSDAWRPKGVSVKRRWTVDGTVVVTGSALALTTAAHAGHTIACAVTGTLNGMATTISTSFALPAAPTNVIPPTVRIPAGTLTPGVLATCQRGTWKPASPTFSVRWIRMATGAEIGTGSTYTLKLPDDNGAPNALGCEVTATNAGGRSVPVRSANTLAMGIAPTITIDPLSMPANLTTDTTAAFTWAIGGGGASSVTCRLDNGPVGPCDTPSSQGYGGLPTSPAGVSHTFTVSAANAAGTAPPASYTWTIAPLAPIVTITGGPTNSTATAATFSWTIGGGLATAIECSIDGGAFVGCASPKTYTGLAAAPGGAPHTFSVRATNANPTTPTATASHSWTVLPQPPTVTIDSGPANPTTSTDASFTWTIGGGLATAVECSLDGAPFAACASPTTYTGLAAAPGGAPHTFSVRVTNANPTTPTATASWSWTVQPEPPTVTITAGPTNPTTSTDATFTWTIDGGGATAVECSLDGGGFAACASGQSYTGLSTSAGGDTHTFSVRATNANPTRATASYTWVVQPPPPTVTEVAVTPGDATSTGPFVVTFAVAGPTTSVACALDLAEAVACSTGDSFPDPGIGMHTMVVTASNVTGSGSDSVSWTYV
jgi:hypothetical protein